MAFNKKLTLDGLKYYHSKIKELLDGKSPTGHTHDDRYFTETEMNTKLNAKLNTSLKGAVNGLAELDANGKVPSSQLPSYVDDVVEGYLYNGKFYKETAHTTQITGETGKIYIDVSTEKTYRWSGSAFVVISETLALGETSSTAYRGDRGKTAYDHSQAAHAPSNAQANVIETVKVNGTALTPSSKAVDITVPSVGNGTVTIKQSGTTKGTFTMNQSGNTTIELTDNNTTYSDMKGATSSAAGTHGLVPAPAAGKQSSFLRGDGNWVVPTDTNTHYASGTVVNNSTTATSNTTSALTNGNVYLNHIENGAVKNSHKISGSGSTTVTSDASGNIVISSTDNNTDTKATQTNTTTSADYRVVLSTNANDTTETNTLRKSTNFQANPSTGEFYAKGYRRIDITAQTLDVNTLNLSSGSPMMMHYIEKTSGGALGISNIPVTGRAFILDVELMRWASNTDYITKQTFMSVDEQANEYVRYCTNGTWGSWTKRVFTDTDTWRGIQNNLTSNSTTDSLSAAQGKVLKGLVDGKAASSHSHSEATDSSSGFLSATDKKYIEELKTIVNPEINEDNRSLEIVTNRTTKIHSDSTVQVYGEYSTELGHDSASLQLRSANDSAWLNDKQIATWDICNRYNKDTVINDSSLDANGEVITTAHYCVSDFIQVTGGEPVYVDSLMPVSMVGVALYDENEQFISSKSSALDWKPVGYVSIPSNCKYIRVVGTYGNRLKAGVYPRKLDQYVSYGQKYIDAYVPKAKVITLGTTGGYYDVTTLKHAVELASDASVSNPYEIQIAEGTYDAFAGYTTSDFTSGNFFGIPIKDGVTLKGMGDRDKTVIYGSIPTSVEAGYRSLISTLNVMGNFGLENLTIKGENLRYAVHDDHRWSYFNYPSGDYVGNIQNCCFILTGDQNNVAYGQGLYGNEKRYFKHCTFIPAFGTHNGSDGVGSYVHLDNCLMDYLTTYDGTGTQYDTVELTGCRFNYIGVYYGGALSTSKYYICGHGNSSEQLDCNDTNYRLNFSNKKEPYVIAIGDSWGVGAGITDGKGGWCARLQSYLGLDSNHYIANPVNGSAFYTNVEGTAWSDQLDTAYSQASNPYNVTDILACGGINDHWSSTEDIASHIAEFVSKANNLFPNAKITLIACSYVGGGDATAQNTTYQDNYTQYLQNVVPAFQTIAKYPNCRYIDGLNFVYDPNGLQNDNYHPTSDECEKLTYKIANAFKNGTISNVSDKLSYTGQLIGGLDGTISNDFCSVYVNNLERNAELSFAINFNTFITFNYSERFLIYYPKLLSGTHYTQTNVVVRDSGKFYTVPAVLKIKPYLKGSILSIQCLAISDDGSTYKSFSSVSRIIVHNTMISADSIQGYTQ